MNRSWRLSANRSGILQRTYERLRRGVNERLVRFLLHECCGRTCEHEAGSDDEGKFAEVRNRRQDCTAVSSGHPVGSAGTELCVLEAGSGSALAASLFRENRNVSLSVCLDIDPEALGEAKTRDPNLHAVAGDLSCMPFRSEVFDLVYNSSTVEHLANPVEAIREMARVAQSDGLVFVGVPYARGPLAFQPLIRRTTAGEWIGPVFTEARTSSLLHGAGLIPVRFLRYFFRFFIGALAVKQWTNRTVASDRGGDIFRAPDLVVEIDEPHGPVGATAGIESNSCFMAEGARC